MDQSTPQAGANLSASPTTTWAIVHSPLGLLGGLPLELRDKIYEYTTGDISTLTIPPDFSNSLLVFITHRLPPGLLLNHQIFNEAAAAYHRRTLLTVTSASVPSPKSLLSEIATSTTFKNLRTLKFTQPQDCYARFSDLASQVAAAECVHAVVRRCPILRDLTMTISADMLFTLSEDLPPSPRTMQKVEKKDAVFPTAGAEIYPELRVRRPSESPADLQRRSEVLQRYLARSSEPLWAFCADVYGRNQEKEA